MPIKPEKLKPQSLNLDIDPKYLKPQEYRYSLNGRIFNFDGRTTRYESVDGTAKAFDLPIGTFPIGYAEFDTLLFVFYTNLNSPNDPFQLVDIKCGIGVHIMGSTKKYILRKQFFNYDDRETYPNDIIAPEGNFDILTELACFNFYGEHRIEAEIEPQYDNSISLYWTDNFNQVSYYNTALKYYENIDTNAIPQDFCNRFKLANAFLMPKIYTPDDLFPTINDPQKNMFNGGDMKCGIYRVAIRYLEENLNPTNWSYLSKPIYIGEGGNRTTKWWKYDGGDSKQDSGKGIRIKIKPVDINYKYIQLAIVQIPQSGFPTEFIISKKIIVKVNTDCNCMYADYRGSIDTDLIESIDELGIDLLSIDTAKSINILNNRLFIANVKPKQYSTEFYKKVINETISFDFTEEPNIGPLYNKQGYYVKQRFGQRYPKAIDEIYQGYQTNFDNPSQVWFSRQTNKPKRMYVGGQLIPSEYDVHAGWGHYRNEWMCFNKTGYFRDQEYSIGIQLVFKDGSKSPLFPLVLPDEEVKTERSPESDIIDFPNLANYGGRCHEQRIKPMALRVYGLTSLWLKLNDQIQGISVYRSDRINDVIIMQGLRQPLARVHNNNPGRFGTTSVHGMKVEAFAEDILNGGDANELDDVLDNCTILNDIVEYNEDENYDYFTGRRTPLRVGENYAVWNRPGRNIETPFAQFTFFSSDLLFRNDANDAITGNVYWKPAYCYFLTNYALFADRTGYSGMIYNDSRDSLFAYFGAELVTTNGEANGPITVKNMYNRGFSKDDAASTKLKYTLSRYGGSLQKDGYLSSFVFNSLTEFYPQKYYLNDKNDSRVSKIRYSIEDFAIYQIQGRREFLAVTTEFSDPCKNMNLTMDKHATFVIFAADNVNENENDYQKTTNWLNGEKSFAFGNSVYGIDTDWNSKFTSSWALDYMKDPLVGYNAPGDAGKIHNIVGYIGNIRKDIGKPSQPTYYLAEYFTAEELATNGDSGAFYCYDGDCYIQQTWFTDLVQLEDQTIESGGDANSGNMIGFYSENTINSEFRFVPKFFDEKLTEKEFGGRDYFPYRSSLFMRTGSERKAQIRLAYGAEDTIKNTVQAQQGIDRDFKEITRYPTRIYWSEPKIQGQRSDNYRNIRQLNFVDEDLSLGEVNKIISINSSLVSVQAQAINFRQVNMDVATKSESGFPIKLGTGEVLRGKPLTVTNQYGSQHQFSIVKSDKAIYGVDYRKQCIWMLLGQQFEIISESKNVSSFVRTYIDTNPNELFYQDKPMYHHFRLVKDCAGYPPGIEPPLVYDSYKAGIYSHYDPEYNEIYFTFYNKNRDINCFHLDVKTIVFNENINAFTGFMFDEGKLNPSMYMVVANKTLVYSPIVTYDDVNQIHYMNIKGSGLMFNQEYLTGLELVGNEDPSAIKKYGSAILHMNMFDRNGDYVYNIPTNTMSIIANNTYQKSVKIYLDQQIGAAGNVRRTEGKYKIFIPRSNVVLPAGEYFKEVLRDYWCGLTIYWTSSDAIKFSLDHIELFSLESNR